MYTECQYNYKQYQYKSQYKEYKYRISVLYKLCNYCIKKITDPNNPCLATCTTYCTYFFFDLTFCQSLSTFAKKCLNNWKTDLLLFLFSLTLISFFPACQAGWTRFGSGCYKNVGNFAYQEGEDTCRMQGGNIYVPTTKEEAYWVMASLG